MISMYEHLFNRSLVWWRLSPGYAAEVANGYAEDPALAVPQKPASRWFCNGHAADAANGYAADPALAMPRKLAAAPAWAPTKPHDPIKELI